MKRTRELLQLFQAKGLGEDVGILPIPQNIHQFAFTGKDTLMDEVVVHLDVLGPCMEDGGFANWMLLRLLVLIVPIGHLHL